MNTPRVSREQAVRLKEVGYDVPTSQNYDNAHLGIRGEDENIPINWNKHSEVYSAPTLDNVCRWLREVHGLHVACCNFT